MTWRSSCPGLRRRSGTGRCARRRWRSSPGPPRCWTRPKPATAEALVLGRAGRLTPGGLRAAIARAVMDVAPEKARKRREQAARDARVQRWAEDSGNAALMGRELPPGGGARRRPADHRLGPGAEEGRAGRRHGRAPRPRLPGPPAGQRLPAPPGRRRGRTPPAARTPLAGRTPQPGRTQRAGRPGRRRSGRRVRASGPGQSGRAPGRRTRCQRDAGRVRRADHPDRPAGDPAGPSRPARGDPRHRPHRPVARPGPGPRRRRPP